MGKILEFKKPQKPEWPRTVTFSCLNIVTGETAKCEKEFDDPFHLMTSINLWNVIGGSSFKYWVE